MAAWVAATLNQILPVITARLAASTGLDATRVLVSVLQPEDVPCFGAAQDVVVRVMHEHEDAAVVDGCGRHDDRRLRLLEISPRTRVQLDASGQDLYRLTDLSLGHLALEDAVVAALQLYSVAGSGGDVWSAPLRVRRVTMPDKLRSNPDWVCSTFGVDLEYRRDLDAALSTQFDGLS